PEDIEAMAATILYRHLDRSQQMEVMELIHSLRNPVLVDQLIRRVVDTTVQPRWGMVPYERRAAGRPEISRMVDDIASKIGIGPTAISGRELAKGVWRRRSFGAKSGALLVGTLALWGTVYGNKLELNRTNKEIQQRTEMRSSPLY